MLIALQNIEKHYGDRAVLKDVNLELQPFGRIALVGRNGAGKSTLLSIVEGEEAPDGGLRQVARGVQVGKLAQEPSFPKGATVGEVMNAAFASLDKLEAELQEKAAAMASGEDADIEAHAELLEVYERRGGFQRRSRRDAASKAFGFTGREDAPAAQLSGGERTRLALAALLIESPDVLLLDEPTNHLDLRMTQWLEGFLGRYAGSVLLISHDRVFLDKVVTQTAHLREGGLKVYNGNYSSFREQLEGEQAALEARHKAEQKAIDALQKSTDRMKIWGLGMSKLARRAKGMQARVDRMKDAAVAAPSNAERNSRIVFHAPESGDLVLDAANVERRIDGRLLFSLPHVQLRRGDRIALIGQNGAGKSTLLQTLLGQQPSDDPKGHSRFGARVKVGHYDQKLSGLDTNLTLFEIARRHTQKDSEAHTLLGTFLFPYEMHDKKAELLSGGEKARLALLELSRQDNNLLVLDEPTNHLDMEMLEALEDALADYDGTLLMVSHDRAFVQHLASQVWHLEGGKLETHLGWEEFEAHGERQKLEERSEKAETRAAATPKPAAPPSDSPYGGLNRYKLQKLLEDTEAGVEKAEARVAECEAAMASAGENADWAELSRAFEDAKKALEGLMEVWAEVSDELETRG